MRKLLEVYPLLIERLHGGIDVHRAFDGFHVPSLTRRLSPRGRQVSGSPRWLHIAAHEVRRMRRINQYRQQLRPLPGAPRRHKTPLVHHLADTHAACFHCACLHVELFLDHGQDQGLFSWLAAGVPPAPKLGRVDGQ
jgi:hypothetical protein